MEYPSSTSLGPELGARPWLSGIILAAGLSRRAGGVNKLLLPGREGAVVRDVAAAFCDAGLDELVLVTGHQAAELSEAVSGLPLRLVHAPDYACGMGASLAAGVRACSPRADGFMVSPADLPGLRVAHVSLVATAFRQASCRVHVVPFDGDQRGHPVVLGAWLRPALEGLSGDLGARVLLAQPSENARLQLLSLPDAAIHRDNDHGLSCRPLCGACCIAPSISTPMPGLPKGKPAGVPCPHLDADYRCRLFGLPERPPVCASLPPSFAMCGSCREEALGYLDKLERQTAP